MHLLPVEELVGLREPEETRSRMWDRDGVEMDLVTHDLRKFVRLMLRRNGYVLEQLLSPLVVHTRRRTRNWSRSPPGVLTTPPRPPLPGFANTQWRLFEKTGELKPLLYTFRALLTGIHLMRTGEVQAASAHAAGRGRRPRAYCRADRGQGGRRARRPRGVDRERGRAEVEALHRVAGRGAGASALPDEPTAYDALHDFVVRVRLTPER